MKNAAKSAFKPNIDWAGAYQAFRRNKDSAQSAGRGSVTIVEEGVDVKEFKSRYKRRMIVAYLSLMFSAFAFISIPFSSNFYSLFYSVICTVLCSLVYYRESYILWVARQWFISGRKMKDGDKLGNKDYINAVMQDAREALPRGL